MSIHSSLKLIIRLGQAELWQHHFECSLKEYNQARQLIGLTTVFAPGSCCRLWWHTSGKTIKMICGPEHLCTVGKMQCLYGATFCQLISITECMAFRGEKKHELLCFEVCYSLLLCCLTERLPLGTCSMNKAQEQSGTYNKQKIKNGVITGEWILFLCVCQCSYCWPAGGQHPRNLHWNGVYSLV